LGLISALVMIAAGILGASNLIVSKKPNAREYIDKLVPYQGWIGVALFIWGIIDVVQFVFSSGSLIGILSPGRAMWLIRAVTELLLGFLLGFGLITKYALSKNDSALEKGRAIRRKLAAYQGTLGLVAIVLGVLFFVSRCSF